MPVQALGLFLAIVCIQPFNLLVAAAVHAIENGVAQRRALGVHGHTVAPQRRKAHAAHVFRINAAFGQQLAG